ncbi:MAG TPA: preprotein translocase subunit SecY [Anaerolineales bacterium]|nr:preprotein translocase subunit SecY [Anaerolineales bacterium]
MKRSPIVTYLNRVAKAQDIRRKLLITLLILIIYRAAAHIPVPGADRSILATLFEGGAGSAFFSILNMLSGGTIETFSVLAMGVYPYITAQIILQLMIPIVPAWKARMEEDQREGRKWMEKWTYVLAIPMAALQSFGQIQLFSSFLGAPVIPNFGFSGSSLLPSVAVIISMTAGTMFAIWLGELISEYGIRQQGLSLIIFAGIVTQIPSNVTQIWQTDDRWLLYAFMLIITALTVFAIVYIQQGRRHVPVMYPGRRVGNRMSMPVKATLPLMVNMAGMIPLIFAQSLLTFPAVLAGIFATSQTTWVRSTSSWITLNFGGETGLYWLMFFVMVVAFTFFYTDVLFAQQNYGENLKRSGAQIPGVVRGEKTQMYLTRVLRRITFPGAFFLGLIAVLPYLLSLLLPTIGLAQAGLNQQAGLLLVSSSGLLIVVGVVRDLFFNIDAELKLHGYDDSLLVR